MLLYSFIKREKYLLFFNKITQTLKIYQIFFFNNFYKSINIFFLANQKNILDIKYIKTKLLFNKKYPVLHTKSLLLKGRGYKCFFERTSRSIVLKLGYSHLIKKYVPNRIKIDLKKNQIVFKSFNLLLLKSYSLNIKALREISPYKKKGLFFSKDIIKLKQVKKK